MFYARAAAQHVKWLTNVRCTRTGITHNLRSGSNGASAQTLGLAPNNTYANTAWSGYQIGNTAQYVQAGWTVPSVVAAGGSQPPGGGGGGRGGGGGTLPNAAGGLASASGTCGFTSGPILAAIGTWTGIGGGYGSGSTQTHPLIQSGTAQFIHPTCTQRFFWYEIYGGATDTGTAISFSLPVSPGNFVANAVIWTPYPAPNLGNLGAADLGVCNYSLSPHECADFLIPNTPQPGNSTEWVVEAPTYGQLLPIADFNSVHLQNALWTDAYTSPNSTPYPINVPGVSLSNLLLQQSNNCPVGVNLPCRAATSSGLSIDGESFTDTFSSTC